MAHPLLRWYVTHCRDLPWRRTKDPYAIWISEIMLQQTQVATVIPYFERWMQRFPTVESLADADEQDVLSQWQGLGYYRRCRLLLEGSKFVKQNGLPRTAIEWKKVPGVGAYTSGAISSIAFNEPSALVDGNVERVFARLTGCSETGNDLNKAAWEWADANVDKQRPGDWNQALMELGAAICTPKNPKCGDCPLRPECEAYTTDLVEYLPVLVPKRATVKLIQHCWIPVHQGLLGVRQIPQGEWWQGMWEFPRANSADELAHQIEGWPQEVGTLTHTVTHHRIALHVSVVSTPTRLETLEWVSQSDLAQWPLPAPQRKAIKLAAPFLHTN